jgi:hypothetical protein
LNTTACRPLLRRYQASAAHPDANNKIVEGSGFCTNGPVESESAVPVKPNATLFNDVLVRERGMVVVTVDWNVIDVPDVTPGVLPIVVVVVVPAAVMGVFVVVDAAGRSAPPVASGNRDAAEPLVGDVNGCTIAASGAAAPARGNGLKTLVPVGGVGGALPTIGEGLKVVADVANGVDAPNRGNGLNTLPPVVPVPWETVDVVTVICCTVTAPA